MLQSELLSHQTTLTIRRARKTSASVNAVATIVAGQTPLSALEMERGRAWVGATGAGRMV